MNKSINELKSEGWEVVSGIMMPTTYPTADHIVMRRCDDYIAHMYLIRDDDSDCPQDNQKVSWRTVKIVQRLIAIVI